MLERTAVVAHDGRRRCLLSWRARLAAGSLDAVYQLDRTDMACVLSSREWSEVIRVLLPSTTSSSHQVTGYLFELDSALTLCIEYRHTRLAQRSDDGDLGDCAEARQLSNRISYGVASRNLRNGRNAIAARLADCRCLEAVHWIFDLAN